MQPRSGRALTGAAGIDGVGDNKVRAVRQTGIPCGVVGAPVCPHNGMPVVQTPLGGS
ncbi:MAG: hypothetical protein WDN24_07775 [Sphingomonas sp.]